MPLPTQSVAAWRPELHPLIRLTLKVPCISIAAEPRSTAYVARLLNSAGLPVNTDHCKRGEWALWLNLKLGTTRGASSPPAVAEGFRNVTPKALCNIDGHPANMECYLSFFTRSVQMRLSSNKRASEVELRA
jgi:hypothetical protein